MSHERTFLGWSRPLCETVPEWILRRPGDGTRDLRDTVVVVPTRQSSWRLRAALPLAAHARGGASLLGPEIVTAPVLLEPPPHADRASELQNLAAWMAVLREVKADEMVVFLGRQRPGTTAWALQIARRLTALRDELADGGWSLGTVAHRGSALAEQERWETMAELERRYLARLDAWGLRDRVADQLAFAADGQLDPEIRRVVLAAVPDPPRLLVTLLSAWAARGGSVEVLVAAPACEQAAFDRWGCPLPAAWVPREISLQGCDVVLAADPEDQAARVGGLIQAALRACPADASGRQRPALAVGVPDREAIGPLQRVLAALGLPAFDPRNRPFADTALYRLVDALLDWQARGDYVETATLLRHPDVLAGGPPAGAVLRELDALQAARLPVTFLELHQAARAVEAAPGAKTASPPPFEAIRAALDRLASWREMLSRGPLSAALRAVLRDVYQARLLHADQAEDCSFQQAATVLDGVLRELARAEETRQAGPDAAAVLLARLQGATIKPERAGEQVDLEGWLELAWNPAPAVCVAGLNEGLVPDSQVSDFFLPDSLRRELALRDDSQRLARDAYVLVSLRAQRTDGVVGSAGRVVLLVGKRSAGGDPLRPSRLLFRCPDADLVARAQALFREPPPLRHVAPYAISFQLDPARVPAPSIQTRLPGRISPTLFRDYLACPFRFYLRYVLGMEACDDRAREPDGAAFGDLCHSVLEAMARDPDRIWACGRPAQLAGWLTDRLQTLAAARYGTPPWLGVTLAVESAARRLQAFAAQQVAWHAQGWEIVASEDRSCTTTLAGITLSGRIDRVDRAPDGQLCILDYKTADKAVLPEAYHLGPAGNEDASELPEAVLSREFVQSLGAGGGARAPRPRRWSDLQLPLYREMLRPRQGGTPQLGYILLPAALGDTAFAIWPGYSDALHAHAIACAEGIIDRIIRGVFWPPNPHQPPFETFADLLLGDPLASVVAPPPPWPPPTHHGSVAGAAPSRSEDAP